MRGDDTLSLPTALRRAGLLEPGRPDRVARQIAALARWGFTLAGGCRQAAIRSPSAAAVYDDRGMLTFAELDSRTTRLARALDGYRMAPGDRLAVLCRNHRGLVETLVAAAKMGADPVLLNTAMPAQQVRTVLDQHEVGVIVADPEFFPLLDRTRTRVPRIGSDTGIDQVIAGVTATPLPPPSRDGRTIMLTSGTTGAPRGAQRPNPPGLGAPGALLSRIPLRVGEPVLIAAPMFHAWGHAGMQMAIALRAPMVLHRRFDAGAVLAAMSHHGCGVLFAVPLMVQRLCELPPVVQRGAELSTLRVVATSGSALPGDLAVRFMDLYGDVLYNLYGSTEVSWVSVANPADLRAAAGTAGRPPRGTKVAILDDHGEPVRPGVIGRIFAANEMLFEGYTNGAGREQLGGLMGTGDLGHVDAAGRLFVDGREDDMVISGGENVFPREVEDLLARLPHVIEVAVVGVPDHDWGQRLAAYVALRPGLRLSEDAVRQHVREHLAKFAVPRDVHFVPALPRNATGKVLTRLLTT